MKHLIVIFFLIYINKSIGQIHDNGIGGYGYIQYELMHNSKYQSNWTQGGGGLIINNVYYAGLYYGSQLAAFNNLISGQDSSLYWLSMVDNKNKTFTLTASEIGGEFGGIIWAEKPLQINLGMKVGAFISNLNDLENSRNHNTRAFFSFSPQAQIALMPLKLIKFQLGIGYKWVLYNDSRLENVGIIGNRNTMFNSFYTSISMIFGSF